MEDNIQQKRQAQIDKLITRDDLLKENDYKFESPIPRYIALECGDDEAAMPFRKTILHRLPAVSMRVPRKPPRYGPTISIPANACTCASAS